MLRRRTEQPANFHQTSLSPSPLIHPLQHPLWVIPSFGKSMFRPSFTTNSSISFNRIFLIFRKICTLLFSFVYSHFSTSFKLWKVRDAWKSWNKVKNFCFVRRSRDSSISTELFNRIIYLFNKNIPSNISKNLYSPLFLRLFSLFYVF